MAHGSEGYSEAELADKIAKLVVNFRGLDPESNPDDEYILDQFLSFVFVQDVAKDVYDDAVASDAAKKLAKAVLGMSAAMEKLAKRNRLQQVKTVMEAMISHGLAEDIECKYRLTPRGRAARQSDFNAVNRDLGEWFQRQIPGST
jgi:hypothetical protein